MMEELEAVASVFLAWWRDADYPTRRRERETMARLHFRLEGRSSEFVDFADFTYFSGALRECLRSVYRRRHPGSGALPKFSIADLKIGSTDVDLQGDSQTVEDLAEAIVSIRHRRFPKHFTFDDVRAFKKLGKPLEYSTSAIEVQSIPIDNEFVQACNDLLDSASESIGEAIGSLDGLNVHARNVFRLYPEEQDRGVECTFDSALFEEVQAALKQRVIVRGTLIRDPGGVTIHRIPAVKSIEILPTLDQMPPITDLFGLFEETPINFNSASDQWG